MTPVTLDSRYRFGRYVLDVPKRRVLLDDVAVDLPWRCLDALTLLVQAQGAVVDREVFFRRLWPGIEVEETGLTKVMSQLRRLLANGDPTTEYVETIPRLGYRLGAPVSVEDPSEAGFRGSSNGGAPPLKAVRPFRWRRLLLWVAAGAAGLVAVAAAGAWAWRSYRNSAEAAQYHEEGRRLRRLGDPDSLHGAVEAFRRATQLNPRKGMYFASLAETLGRVPVPGRKDSTATREAAERAVELEPKCGDCRAVLGFTLFSMFWEWQQAETQLRRAIDLMPGQGGVRGYMAMYLCTQRRPEEALKHIDESLRLEPFWSTGHQIRSMVLLYLRRYPESLSSADRALSINPQNKSVWDGRASALLEMGRDKEALAAWQEFGWSQRASELDARFRAKGMRGAVERLLELTGEGAGRETSSYRRARWKMYLGDIAGAMEELEVAHRFRHFNLMYVAADPIFEPAHSHPRFRKLLEDMRLPQPVR